MLTGGSEIDYSVVKSGLHLDDGGFLLLLLVLLLVLLLLFFLLLLLLALLLGLFLLGGGFLHLGLGGLLLLLLFFRFKSLIRVELVRNDLPAGVGNLKGKTVGGSADDKELGDLQFDLLGATLDGFAGVGDFTGEIDDALVGDVGHVGDHLLGGGFGLEGTGLQGVEVLSEDDEAVVALAPHVVNSGPHQDFLALLGFVDLLEGGPDSVGAVEGADEGVVAVLVFVKIGNFYFFVCFHELVLKI